MFKETMSFAKSTNKILISSFNLFNHCSSFTCLTKTGIQRTKSSISWLKLTLADVAPEDMSACTCKFLPTYRGCSSLNCYTCPDETNKAMKLEVQRTIGHIMKYKTYITDFSIGFLSSSNRQKPLKQCIQIIWDG